MPPVQTIPAGSRPRNQINPNEDLYTIRVPTTLVQIPVMVKDSDGRRVDGLLPKDFTVLENGKKQTLSYFSSDPFELSVAIVLDTGMSDVTLQKVNQTYGSLVGAFSPYDEVALYTYSSTVSQVTDFSGRLQRLTDALNEMKLVRGHDNGPPILNGPLGPNGPTINGDVYKRQVPASALCTLPIALEILLAVVGQHVVLTGHKEDLFCGHAF